MNIKFGIVRCCTWGYFGLCGGVTTSDLTPPLLLLMVLTALLRLARFPSLLSPFLVGLYALPRNWTCYWNM